MKTFIAVLAAGAILMATFLGWVRVDRWETGKKFLVAKLDAALDAPGELPNPRYVSEATLETRVESVKERKADAGRVAGEILEYLGSKPFGLPLSPDERGLREDCVRLKP